MTKIGLSALALAGATALAGCSHYYHDDYASYPAECYDEEGYLYEDCGDGYGYDGYGYGSVGIGLGYGYGGYGYGWPGYGWYNGFYYPGYSIYVFDRSGRRHRWDDRQRDYWERRRERAGNDGRTRDWDRRDVQDGRADRESDRAARAERRGDGAGRDGRAESRAPDAQGRATRQRPADATRTERPARAARPPRASPRETTPRSSRQPSRRPD